MRRTVEALAFLAALAILAYEVTRPTPWPLAVGLAVVALVGVFVSVGDRRAHAREVEIRELGTTGLRQYEGFVREEWAQERRELMRQHGITLSALANMTDDSRLDWRWPKREQS